MPVDPNGNEKKYKANQQSNWTNAENLTEVRGLLFHIWCLLEDAISDLDRESAECFCVP